MQCTEVWSRSSACRNSFPSWRSADGACVSTSMRCRAARGFQELPLEPPDRVLAKVRLRSGTSGPGEPLAQSWVVGEARDGWSERGRVIDQHEQAGGLVHDRVASAGCRGRDGRHLERGSFKHHIREALRRHIGSACTSMAMNHGLGSSTAPTRRMRRPCGLPPSEPPRSQGLRWARRPTRPRGAARRPVRIAARSVRIPLSRCTLPTVPTMSRSSRNTAVAANGNGSMTRSRLKRSTSTPCEDPSPRTSTARPGTRLRTSSARLLLFATT